MSQRDMRRAENDREACGAGIHQLGQQHTDHVGVDPHDQDSHSRQEGDEGQKVEQAMLPRAAVPR